MFVHPEQVTQLATKVAEIASAQFVVTRTGHEDNMEMRIVLKDPAAASDALGARIVETAREITRLRGEVRLHRRHRGGGAGEEDHRQTKVGLIGRTGGTMDAATLNQHLEKHLRVHHLSPGDQVAASPGSRSPTR